MTNAPVDSEFRFYLQQQLINRCRQNPRYSLRAFARFLDVESSALSKILRGQRDLSRKTFTKVATRLGFSQEEQETWASSLKERRGRPKLLPTSNFENSDVPYQQLSLD